MSFFKRITNALRPADTAGLDEELEAAITGGAPVDAAAIAKRRNAGEELVASRAQQVRERLLRAQLEADYEDGQLSMLLGAERYRQFGFDEHNGALALEAFAVSKLQPVFKQIVEDGMVDDDEQALLDRVLARMPGLTLDAASTEKLGAMRAKWQRLLGAFADPLVPVDAPVLLKPKEYCVHVVRAEASEVRQRTVRASYAGPRARINLGGGISYAAGSYSVARSTEDYHHSFGLGALCATNKRLLWVGQDKSISISLGNVVRFDRFTDGLLLFKGTGKPLMFEWPEPDFPSTIRVTRAIEELRS